MGWVEVFKEANDVGKELKLRDSKSTNRITM